VVLTAGATTRRSELWSYDDEDPTSLDYDFTLRRLGNLATLLANAEPGD
jgi:hypothetical protein